MISPAIAIIGAGPAGCYAADQLSRKLADARIDVFDRLPTPYGLVRGGVAPDHQGTKNIVRQFERTFQRPNVRFLGHVEIGRDLEFAELAEAYDATVVAIGALEDRALGIAGEQLTGVVGSGRFVSWYNGIPGAEDLSPLLDARSVAVVGNGNVALDIVRLLGKRREDLLASDMARPALEAIAAAPLTDLWLIGRRGPAEASFTSAELSELGELARVSIVLEGAAPEASAQAIADPAAAKVSAKNLEILSGFASSPADRPVRLHLLFNAAPQSVAGEGRAERLRLARTLSEGGQATLLDETFEIPAELVIGAIGYRSKAIPGLPFDDRKGIVTNVDGRVTPGIYACGWCRRGPQGVIPANRADALAVADLVMADLAASTAQGRPGPTAIDPLLRQRAVEVVDFAGWKRIDAAETGRAEGRPREKITLMQELLSVANAT